jgi:hypothetical protein
MFVTGPLQIIRQCSYKVGAGSHVPESLAPTSSPFPESPEVGGQLFPKLILDTMITLTNGPGGAKPSPNALERVSELAPRFCVNNF